MLVSFVGTLDTSKDTADARFKEYQEQLNWTILPRITKDFLAHVQVRRDSNKGLTSIFTWAGEYPDLDARLFRDFALQFNTYGEACELRNGAGEPTKWLLTLIKPRRVEYISIGSDPGELHEVTNGGKTEFVS